LPSWYQIRVSFLSPHGAPQPTDADLAAEATAKAALWALAAALPGIRTIIPVTLELSTSNYLLWRDMFSDTVEKYALEDHLLKVNFPADPNPQWNRNDAMVIAMAQQ
jgi:hypothetical protein